MKARPAESEHAISKSVREYFMDSSNALENDPRPAVSVVPVGVLLPADSPRQDGVHAAHAELLAGTDAELPPILVHQHTMRVIDGMHRLRAAQLRGDETIAVRWFDGADDLAFVLAVEANVTHGLPLSRADREAAATRILTHRPQWSDRAVAKVTGLSAKTVRAVRERATAHLPRLHARLGQDGRVRPVSSADGRRRASEILAARPDTSLRDVARMAGISPGTVRDVRMRMLREEDPVPACQRRDDTNAKPGSPAPDPLSALRTLRRDPSLRYSVTGRALLRWLHMTALDRDGWRRLAGDLPEHCADTVADLARGCATELRRFADELAARGVVREER
jgi:hypothetical protein